MFTSNSVINEGCVITDTHYGARKNSKLFHDYFEKFYRDVFFPNLKKYGIDTVIHLGDAFDSVEVSNSNLFSGQREWYLTLSKNQESRCTLIVGNHDIYYKNSNEINSVELLLTEYDNIVPYSKATEVNIGGLGVLFIPWICEDNEKETHQLIKRQTARSRWGTLAPTDLELIDKSSWIMVMRSSYIQSSPRSSAVTTTLDRMMDGSSTSEIHTKCSGQMYVIGEDSPSWTQKLLNIFT